MATLFFRKYEQDSIVIPLHIIMKTEHGIIIGENTENH